MNKSVKIRLYGGPYDGAEVEVEGHCAERLFPRPTPEPSCMPADELLAPEPMHVYVYKRNTFAYRYEFAGVRAR
jgi:hypothetical protein